MERRSSYPQELAWLCSSILTVGTGQAASGIATASYLALTTSSTLDNRKMPELIECINRGTSACGRAERAVVAMKESGA
jgi:hypothetical protein